jgi:transcription antitermination factor NusG
MVVDPCLKKGDEVVISGGAFHGITAVVETLLSGRDRVRVLFEFLGKTIAAEVSSEHLAPKAPARFSSVIYQS